jgi:tRNA pseudouridine13 synthase
MKLKQRPDDFQVEELTARAPADEGAFAFYRLEKSGWSTPDALAALRRRWKLEPRRLSYGGLKDRHARTVQYLTVFHGPRRGLKHHDIQVTYLGQLPQPYLSQDVLANRFRLVVRDLSPQDVEHARQALAEVRAQGVPNYFDDQRFGSVGQDHEFIARLMVLGQFEQALRLALTAPYEHDRAAQKQEKAILRDLWGDWQACKDRLPRSHARSLVDYLLHHPTDFRGALARLRPELRGLYLSAYQSHLWNRMLALWLRQHCPAEQLQPVDLQLGTVPMHRELDAAVFPELEKLLLPLPSARLKLDVADARLPLVRAILTEEGLELKQMQIKGIRELFFSRGDRAALCRPNELQAEAAEDEHHRGRRKMTLSFELPRGCYATLIVKRVFQAG